MLKTSLYAIPLCMGILSCSGEAPAEDGGEEATGASELILVTSNQFEIGDMLLGGFDTVSFSNKIETTGLMDVPPENKSTVSAYFGGYVKEIKLIPGQYVKKGDALFKLENPDYIQIQQDFLETKSQLVYLKADYERQLALSNENVSSQKTFLKAQSDYEVMEATYESLKKKLELMNISPASITPTNLRSTIVVNSPISGYVTSVDASSGMFLNPSDKAVTIMNTDHIHLELAIFEKDLMHVKIDQAVSFTIQNNPTVYEAKVYLINHAIDSEKRTVQVHCHLKDEALTPLFTPGMFAEATVITEEIKGLGLPESAVVNREDRNYILIKVNGTNADEYQFEQREVIVGDRQNGYIQILNIADFPADAQILVNGAFNLINE